MIEKVELTAGDIVRNFDFGHAENLLRIEEKLKRRNWVLTDKRYTWNNGLIKRASKETNTGTPASKGTAEGDKTRRTATISYRTSS